jgi:hypothetical protein
LNVASPGPLGFAAWRTTTSGDYERRATTLAGLHFLAFACLTLHRFTVLI